jgi:hypothetical protein
MWLRRLWKGCRPTAKSPYCELYRNFKRINYTKAAIIRAGRLGQPDSAERAHDGQR